MTFCYNSSNIDKSSVCSGLKFWCACAGADEVETSILNFNHVEISTLDYFIHPLNLQRLLQNGRLT